MRASDKTFPKSLFYAVSEFCLTFERLPFSGLGFQSVGRAKLSVPMWLGTQGTRIQFTGLVDGCGASGTRHCVDLFSGKFSGLHCPIMERSKAGMLLNIAHEKAKEAEVLAEGCGDEIVSKSEQLWWQLRDKMFKGVTSHWERSYL